MRGFDLVLTYNWGAIDAVMARRLFGGPPLVHHEDGFNEDEAERAQAEAQPVPPPRAAAAHAAGRALAAAGADRARGLAPAARAGGAHPQRHAGRALSASRRRRTRSRGFERRPGEVVIGTVAGLRAVKNLPRLVRAFAGDAAQAMRSW